MINLKTPEEIEYIRASGRIAAGTLDYLSEKIQTRPPRITTEKLDSLGHEYILEQGATALL